MPRTLMGSGHFCVLLHFKALVESLLQASQLRDHIGRGHRRLLDHVRHRPEPLSFSGAECTDVRSGVHSWVFSEVLFIEFQKSSAKPTLSVAGTATETLFTLRLLKTRRDLWGNYVVSFKEFMPPTHAFSDQGFRVSLKVVGPVNELNSHTGPPR